MLVMVGAVMDDRAPLMVSHKHEVHLILAAFKEGLDILDGA